MTNILGGNSAAKKAAAESRAQQAVANDRQLAALQASDQKDATTRRNPRGRRLFTTDAASKGNLS